MINLTKNKNLLGLISIICIIGFVSSSFAASVGVPQMLPEGKIHVYDGSQKIAVVTAESPLPQGKMLKVDGKCGIRMDSLYLVATDKSTLMVRTEKRGQELFVKDGRVFFGITAINDPISFFTPNGGVVAQQVMIKASSQSPILEGYVDVSGKNAEIGVISGGSMVVSTADGEVTVNEGQRILLAQATGGAETVEEQDDTVLAPVVLLAIVGGILAVPIIWGAVKAGDDNKTASPK